MRAKITVSIQAAPAGHILLLMKKLRHAWEALHASLWFIPMLLVAGAVILAAGLIEVDTTIDQEQLAQSWPRLFGAGAEGSRGLLSAVATSMITIAGVSYSITVVALTLASSQYTSRILSNFMRDRANQTVLGVFLGVFAYSLVVLRTIRGNGDPEGAFVPALAVFAGMLLALVAIGFLIFFIHHVAASIQAGSIVEAVANKTLKSIDRFFPAAVDEAQADALDRGPTGGAWAAIPACKSGYIRDIDVDALSSVACHRAVTVRMMYGVGAFVTEGCALAEVSGGQPDSELIHALNAACAVGSERTLDHDVGFGIRQIVDVALKALSPGINDTTTAINCVDYLGVILARLAVRRIETPDHFNGGQQQIVLRGPTFSSLLAEAVDQIRQNARGNVAVLTRLLQMLHGVALQTPNAHRLRALRQHADLVAEAAESSIPAAYDRATVQVAGKGVTTTPGQGSEAGQ